MENVAKTAYRLENWIREMVTAAGAAGTLVGLSGGIDSAVVAILCHQAFPLSTLGVIMPCYSCQEDERLARLVAEKFAIPYRLVELDPAYDCLVDAVVGSIDEDEPALLAKANIKPRLRMTVLYALAAHYNYLVVGTGNRSELAVGYFTKYGDGGVDLLPLGGLVKEEVWSLARYLGIPQEIIDRPPSGGLWPGQTDEAEMGLTYKDLDAYLQGKPIAPAVRNRIEELALRSRHKRCLPPIPEI